MSSSAVDTGGTTEVGKSLDNSFMSDESDNGKPATQNNKAAAYAYICSACYQSLTTKVRSVGLARRRNSVPTTGTLFYPIHTPKGA